MLSRVADRLYWMARYLERVENSARLLDVHTALLLDLPADTGIGWDPILDILGCREDFQSQSQSQDASAIQSFVIRDPANPNSLASTLKSARENARTTRDLIPTEAWRTINELQLFAQKQLASDKGRTRQDALKKMISRCQTISGLLAGTMSQGPAYQFIKIGRNLERADMTTRMIDIAAAILMAGREELERYDNTLWMTILKSLSAYQMYRQYVRRRVYGPDVIDFLLMDPNFPRAVTHCLGEVESSLKKLPRPDHALSALNKVLSNVQEISPQRFTPEFIHDLIDRLQIEFGIVHDAIRSTWLSPDEAAA